MKNFTFLPGQIGQLGILGAGGGIGMAPLRSLFIYLLDHRADYGGSRLYTAPVRLKTSALMPTAELGSSGTT